MPRDWNPAADRRNGRRSDSRGGSARRRGGNDGRGRDGDRDRRGHPSGYGGKGRAKPHSLDRDRDRHRRDEGCGHNRRGDRSHSRRRGSSHKRGRSPSSRGRGRDRGRDRSRSRSHSRSRRRGAGRKGGGGGGSSSSSSSGPSAKGKGGGDDDDDSPSGTDEDEIIHFDWKPDMVLNSRYRLSKLLGDGTFGRVVHAHDQRSDREVAIKIIRDVKRYMENAQIEADILKDIRKADPEGKHGNAIMYETFVHETKFFCLVFEPLGTSLYDFLKDNEYRGYWMQDIQAFGRQCMQALAFLHDKLRMTHTDLKPENVLLYSQQPAIPSQFPREAEWLRQNRHPPDHRVKQYLRPCSNAIKIIDFGNATYENEQHSSIINTRQYRGPEVLLSCGWNELSDQWSIGCILMELYSGNQLFETHEELEHLALMERVIGHLPSVLVDSASKSAKEKWFEHRSGSFRLAWPDRSSSASSERHVACQRSLHKQVPSAHSALAEFCADLLELEPRKRKSASAMLRHPFLTKSAFEGNAERDVSQWDSGSD